jgi:hypothetical protein
MFSWSTFPTCPTVARQESGTRRISPEGSRRTAKPSSFATSWIPEPALAPSAALAGLELDVVDDGSGRDPLERQRVPGRMSAAGPDSIAWPTRTPGGARM